MVALVVMIAFVVGLGESAFARERTTSGQRRPTSSSPRNSTLTKKSTSHRVPLRPNQVVRVGNESYVNVPVNGQNYFLWQSRSSNGKVTAQSMISIDRKEIVVDKNNDGFADHWEMATANASIRMFQPYRGQFLFMEIEHRFRPDAGILLKYSYDSKTDQYLAYGFEPKTYKKLSLNDFVVGCRADENDLQVLSRQLVDWTKKDENANLLRRNIKEDLLDESCKCTGPGVPAPICKSDFKSALPYIVDGIMKVVQSDDPSVQPGDGNNKGEFLQCLRYLNLNVHAARISSGLAQFAEGLVPKNSRFPWRVRCEINTTEYGSFDNAHFLSEPTVTFHKNMVTLQAALTKTLNGPETKKNPITPGPPDFIHSYAETFFHEMLHYSMIEDETVVDAIVQCCKNPDNVRSKECDYATDMVHTREAAQKLQAVTAEMEPESWRDFRNGMVHQYGLHANPVIDEFFNEAGRRFNSVADQTKCKEQTNEAAKKQCNTEFAQIMQELLLDYFTGENPKCGAYAQGTQKIVSTNKKGEEYDATASDLSKPDEPEAMSEENANNFCMELQGLMIKLYNLPTDKVTNMMACKGAALPIEKQNSFYAWLLLQSWLRTDFAHAALPTTSDTGSKLICRAFDNVKKGIDFSDIQWTTTETSPPPAILPMVDTPGQLDDWSGKTGGTGKIGPPPGSVGGGGDGGEVIRPSPSVPSPPLYGQTNTDRVRQIEEHLTRTKSVIEQTRVAASKIGNILLPQAKAADYASTKSESASGVSSPTLKSPRINLAQVRRVQLPEGGLPNPFGNASRGIASTSKKGGAMAEGGIDGAKGSASSKKDGGSNSGRKVGKGAPSTSSTENASSGAPGLPSSKGGEKNSISADDTEPELAKEDVIRSLLRPYRLVRPDLARPVVIAALLKYRITVIDHEGRVHGERPSNKREPSSAFKKIEFIYSRKADRLVRSP